MKKIIMVFFIFLLIKQNVYAEKLLVYVSILPQKYFAEKIMKDRAEVKLMVLPGHSPALYNPNPGQMSGLSRAQIYFSIGVPFEKRWLPKIKTNFKNISVVDSSKGILKRTPDQNFLGNNKYAHNHNDKHGFYDPHIWMSPLNGVKIARNMMESAIKEDPDNADYYLKNYKLFADSALKLDFELFEQTKNIKNRNIMVFHPAFGYFMSDYGLNQIPVEMEGKEPTSKHMGEIFKFAKKNNIKILLVQPQFPSSSTKMMENILKLKVYRADPLAYEWDKNLIKIAKIIQ